MRLQPPESWRQTHEMPLLLRLFCQGAMLAGPILLFLVVLPVTEYTVDGQLVTYAEFWSSGLGLSSVLFLLLLTFGCWGLAARAPRSRWALVVAPIASYVPLIASNSPLVGNVTFIDALSTLLPATIIYVCLFHVPSVHRYLTRRSKETSSAV